MDLQGLGDRVVTCTRCPRLVSWREAVAATKRAAYRDEDYWGRPVPGFGDPQARLLVLGLAPGAHGANRTGRAFTGDGAGAFLFRALHRAGLASAPRSVASDDGLHLTGTWVTNAVKCVPPANAPTAAERAACAPYLDAEQALLGARVVLALGATGWAAGLRLLGVPRPRPRFAHGAEVAAGEVTLIASYHPSRQNTNTGRLTQAMLDGVVARAAALAGLP
jgi:uracil-DNA glycosylase